VAVPGRTDRPGGDVAVPGRTDRPGGGGAVPGGIVPGKADQSGFVAKTVSSVMKPRLSISSMERIA